MNRLMLITLFLAFACQPKPQVSTTSGYVSDGLSYLWPVDSASNKVIVPVCWEQLVPEQSQSRLWVQTIVQQEYARARFEFRGWQACQPGSAGVRISTDDQPDVRVEAFGYKLNGLANGMKLNLTFKNSTWTGICLASPAAHQVCVEDDALHEFGHAVGLRHEHSRPDSICNDGPDHGIGETGAIAIGAYDPKSIMNYCEVRAAKNSTTTPVLSPGDVATIQQYYFSGKGPVLQSNTLANQCRSDGNTWVEEGTIAHCVLSPTGTFRSIDEQRYAPVLHHFDLNNFNADTITAATRTLRPDKTFAAISSVERTVAFSCMAENGMTSAAGPIPFDVSVDLTTPPSPHLFCEITVSYGNGEGEFKGFIENVAGQRDGATTPVPQNIVDPEAWVRTR